MKDLFRKLFLIKEIKSKLGILHFQRWRIVQTPWFSIYIHRIFREDEDQHCHSHPWSFVSFILNGSYTEKYPDDSSRYFSAPLLIFTTEDLIIVYLSRLNCPLQL